jgi:undecaprenyl-diphosphatase
MNKFDFAFELFLNQFVGRHHWFDRMIGLTNATNLLQGGVMVLLIVWLLFDRDRPGQLRKGYELLLGSVFFSLLAVLTARALALSLPFKVRPIADPPLHFRLPAGESLVLINWSAFPSDHAALFFGLATAILMTSKRVGLLAFSWVVAGVCFPLLYLGVHWPTDILMGAILGVFFAQFARIPVIREFVRRKVIDVHQNHARVFFAILFLWSYETIILYDDVRSILKWLAHAHSARI